MNAARLANGIEELSQPTIDLQEFFFKHPLESVLQCPLLIDSLSAMKVVSPGASQTPEFPRLFTRNLSSKRFTEIEKLIKKQNCHRRFNKVLTLLILL